MSLQNSIAHRVRRSTLHPVPDPEARVIVAQGSFSHLQLGLHRDEGNGKRQTPNARRITDNLQTIACQPARRREHRIESQQLDAGKYTR